jgi:aminocarboxymuconate-semialdehyde decarboxylase
MFLGTSASVVAAASVGTGFRGATVLASTQGGGERRAIVVGGQRVKTVDVHAHTVIPGTMELVGDTTPTFNGLLVITPERIRVMDELGIDVEVLSINPFWYGLDVDAARRVIKYQNEGLAKICAANPDRFVALASVALQHPELAAEQLESGINTYGLRGVAVGGSVVAEEFASPRFDPFWAKVEALAVPMFIHPQGVPGLSRLEGNGLLTNVIGNPLDTTIALSHLIFEGVLDRFPGLKIVAAHGGGYLASYADRSDYGCKTFPSRCDKSIEKRPTDYLKEMYFDSLVFSSEALAYLVDRFGANHIVIGSDYPYAWVSRPVDHVLETPDLSDADRIAILGGNAMELFGIST